MNNLVVSNRLKKFQDLDQLACERLALSKQRFTEAFLALDLIRRESLYTEGGFNSWREYTQAFAEHNGVSRSLLYENLSAVRLAIAAGFSDSEIMHYDLYTIKPYFTRGGPVLDYDRNTGRILEIAPVILEQLPEGETLGERYGEWVKDSVDAKQSPPLVRQELNAAMRKVEITFCPLTENGEWIGIEWSRTEGDDWDEGLISFLKDPNLPEDVRIEMLKRLRVHKDFIE